MHINDNIALCVGRPRKRGQAFGIELEYEGWRGQDDGLTKWNAIGDPSLRNNGIEFVSNILKQGDILPALDEIKELLRGTRITASTRCGIHVHINMLDSSWAQLWNLSTLYTLLEPTIFETYAPNRKNNHFCIPSHSNNALATIMSEDIMLLRQGAPYKKPKPKPAVAKQQQIGMNPRQMRHQGIFDVVMEDMIARPQEPVHLRLYGSNKYSAMNFARLRDLGTVEMRQFPGTTDMRRVREWVNFLSNIQRVSQGYDDPLAILEQYNTRGLDSLLQEVDLPAKIIDEMDQDEAEFAATTMAGYIPRKWSELDWTIEEGA